MGIGRGLRGMPRRGTEIEAMRKTPYSSSTATKALIAVTGLGLIAYLLLHLAGNLMVFAGPAVFNRYSHVLVSSPITLPLEIVLGAIFIFHIYKALRNYLANRKARPVGYYKLDWAGDKSRRTPASWTMIVTGLTTLLFILIHLKGLRFGTEYHVEGSDVRDLYRVEMEHFSNPLTVAFYVLAMVILGFHLWHGFWSSLQSLGLGSSRYTPRLVTMSKVVAGVLAGGFILITLWVFFVAAPGYNTSLHPLSGSAR
jgi:succinate dehydrogenase / fumarate reductase, cytochrome b subunit